MRVKGIALTTACLVALLLVAGCGGGSDSSTTSNAAKAGSGEANGEAGDNAAEQETTAGAIGKEAPPITKAAFIKRADALCERVRTKLVTELTALLQEHGATARGGSGKALSELEPEAVGAILVPNYEAELNGMRALGAPRGDEAQISAILVAMEGVVAEAQAEPLAFSVPASEGPAKHAIAISRKYGLDICPMA